MSKEDKDELLDLFESAGHQIYDLISMVCDDFDEDEIVDVIFVSLSSHMEKIHSSKNGPEKTSGTN